MSLAAIQRRNTNALHHDNSGWASQVAQVVKSLPANAGDRLGFDPGSGSFPGGGHSNPLQDSCLENPMDRGAWQAIVQRVTKNQTQLSH